jgi:hypothetical protein
MLIMQFSHLSIESSVNKTLRSDGGVADGSHFRQLFLFLYISC